MAGSKKAEVEVTENLPTQVMRSSEITPLGLVIKRDQIEGILVTHRLVKQAAFNMEPMSSGAFPTLVTGERIVTDLVLAIRTSPILIDRLLAAEEAKQLPKGIKLITGDEDADEDEEVVSDPDRVLIEFKGCGGVDVSYTDTALTESEIFMKADKGRDGELTEFVEKMGVILNKLSEDQPMVLGMREMVDDEMLTSPAGKAALITAESTEARRATERMEELSARFRKGLSQLEKVLQLDKDSDGVPVNPFTHAHLREHMDAAYMEALNSVLASTDV